MLGLMYQCGGAPAWFPPWGGSPPDVVISSLAYNALLIG